MTLRLPPRPVVRDWPADTIESWQALSLSARGVTRRAGTGRRFEEHLAELRRLIDAGSHVALLEAVSDRSKLRALATIWLEDADRAERSVSIEILQRMVELHSMKFSLLTTYVLVHAYLKYFDRMDDWAGGVRAAFADVLGAAVAHQSSAGRGDDDTVAELLAHPEFYFGVDGPGRLAEALHSQGASLPLYFRRAGLLGSDNGRFGELVRYALYIVQIREADPDEDHDFLREIAHPDVINAPGSAGQRFGHDLLIELLRRTEAAPGAAWLETVLDIAGDPRMRATARYLQWWNAIPDDLRARAVRWLSAQDLKLFLLAVEAFGVEGDIDALNRLFPSRKRFLQGLYDSGFVRETRLILGDEARDFVRQRVGKELRASLSILEGPNSSETAIIYMDCGTFHIVEGSHNFKIWTYLGEPDDAFVNRARMRFSRRDLITTIPQRHRERFGWNSVQDKAHQGFWQRDPIYFLAANNIPLPLEAVLDRADYDALKYKFGLPRVRL
ncbi:EH signature domain-containing protein [Salinibacterium sp. SYSU T00001]|uniref:EH signature domain-containing protein n=1 Tax=Homoserinimonas sedimenticola TaxID=2986805 RepID=UPI00223624DA|nr:EH signature domain-containing protein [Salinibacterium sedimenticola]MCW4386321.1 EH signature domain-containing protein [Salinibacterium sedimenticola]